MRLEKQSKRLRLRVPGSGASVDQVFLKVAYLSPFLCEPQIWALEIRFCCCCCLQLLNWEEFDSYFLLFDPDLDLVCNGCRTFLPKIETETYDLLNAIKRVFLVLCQQYQCLIFFFTWSFWRDLARHLGQEEYHFRLL